MLGPPPLVSVGLRQETLDLVLLLQRLWGVLHPPTMDQLAVNLEDDAASHHNLLANLKRNVCLKMP